MLNVVANSRTIAADVKLIPADGKLAMPQVSNVLLIQNLQKENGGLCDSDIHLTNSELSKISANECDS